MATTAAAARSSFFPKFSLRANGLDMMPSIRFFNSPPVTLAADVP
jgi:hypothetical protein